MNSPTRLFVVAFALAVFIVALRSSVPGSHISLTARAAPSVETGEVRLAATTGSAVEEEALQQPSSKEPKRTTEPWVEAQRGETASSAATGVAPTIGDGGGCRRNALPLWNLEDALGKTGASGFCERNGGYRALRSVDRPQITVGLMMGTELDMLEVALYEMFPVVDLILLTESTTTHSLKTKLLLWEPVASKQGRFTPYLSKIVPLVFTPSKKYSSGWDIEKRQRQFFLRQLKDNVTLHKYLRPRDLIIANTDLDEIFSRRLLLMYKMCDLGDDLRFEVFQFRYNVNCLQETTVTVYPKLVFHPPPELRQLSKMTIYQWRNVQSQVLFDSNNINNVLATNRTVWHFSGFGGLDALIRKYENSPHRFLGEMSRDKMERMMRTCSYADKKRFRVEPSVENLPLFVQGNECYFRHLGWIVDGKEKS